MPQTPANESPARAMLLNAEEFRKAAIMLESYPFLSGLDPHIIIPMMVCYAFATEMYLKFLLSHVTGRDVPETHDLEELFRNLPKPVKRRIKKAWENPPGIEANIRNAIESKLGRSRSFEETLSDSAHAFVSLRYHYELGNVTGFNFSGDLLGAIRRVIFELYPTEFSDIRLPLPIGAVPADVQNSILTAVRPPASQCS
ncbi:hypothetical protein [Bradyrhizobium sp. F1.13.3]|uniref:hypothetical protein n=1 Tax=Bradyrhizobium sp. F1.13.3 TaxID=3156351 RepID=UPI003396C0C2